MLTDSEGNVCPFCVDNGQVTVIDETPVAYLCQVVKNVGGVWTTQVGRYFIIPKRHTESILERPNNWTLHENQLLWRALLEAEGDEALMSLMGDHDLADSLNISWNNGFRAGRRVRHSHMWVIFRYDGLEVGLDGAIEICGQQKAELDQLRTPVVAGPNRPIFVSRPAPFHEPDDPQF